LLQNFSFEATTLDLIEKAHFQTAFSETCSLANKVCALKACFGTGSIFISEEKTPQILKSNQPAPVKTFFRSSSIRTCRIDKKSVQRIFPCQILHNTHQTARLPYHRYKHYVQHYYTGDSPESKEQPNG
jgi:hypothetical protein